MKSKVRSFLCASIGPGLTLFTACSAALNGPLALATTLGFVATVAYGIIEMALLTYTPIDSIELTGPSLLIEDSREETAPANREADMIEFPATHEHSARAA